MAASTWRVGLFWDYGNASRRRFPELRISTNAIQFLRQDLLRASWTQCKGFPTTISNLDLVHGELPEFTQTRTVS